MNKIVFTFSLGTLLCLGATAQVINQTVSVGPGYANQKWYSLENGELSSQPKDNWDLAFEITGFSSAILANTQRANFAVYNAPFKIDDYGILDTAGIKNWSVLNNSDTSWAVGALNKGANPNNPSDLGWGVYDMNTHFVMGDSCFVLKLSATSFKKLKIVSLASGAYTFEYADINGANSFTQTITKASYQGKNFVYVNMTTNAIVDREPVSANWDLTFVKYISFVPPAGSPYGVTGILHNKGVRVAQANNVTGAATYTNFGAHMFNSAINEIGYDWKEVNMSSFAWEIKMDTVFFVKDKPGSIWKVRPISFGGSATGDFVFSKEKLLSTTVGIDKAGKAITQFMVYPNPSNASTTNLIFSSEKAQSVSVSILDLNGRLVSSEGINVPEGLTTQVLSTEDLKSGVYFVKVNSGSYSTMQKLIIQ